MAESYSELSNYIKLMSTECLAAFRFDAKSWLILERAFACRMIFVDYV